MKKFPWPEVYIILTPNKIESMADKFLAKNNTVDKISTTSEHLLHQFAFNNSAQANIISISGNGIVIAANRAACKLLGYSKKELLTKRSNDIFDIQENSFKKMLKLRAVEGEAKAEVTLIKKTGQQFRCQVTSAVFTENGIEKLITTITDMSESILLQENIDAGKEKIVARNIQLAKDKQKIIDSKNKKIVAHDILAAHLKQKGIDAKNKKSVANDILAAHSKQKGIDAKNKKIVANDIKIALV